MQFYSFGRNIAEHIQNPDTRLVSCEKISGLENVQEYSATELWEITRLRLMGEKPLIFETSYIPVSLLPEVTEQELQQFSLYNLLSKNKVRVVRAKEYLEPVLPSLEVQEVLEIGPATALFQTLRYTYDAGEELVELRESLIRGDYINFSVEMTL